MKNKTIISALIIMLVIIVGGVVWQWEKAQKNEQVSQRQQQEIIQDQNQKSADDGNKNEQEDEIASVQDLIDGEYQFENVDTSDWQTYRNDEVGYEIKIPKGWFCGGIALNSGSKKSVVCLNENKKKDYYAGKVNDNIVMINFPDVDNIIIDDIRDNLMTKKKNGSNIYKTIIDNKTSILAIDKYNIINVYDYSNKWNLVLFSLADKKISDGLLQTFKLLK